MHSTSGTPICCWVVPSAPIWWPTCTTDRGRIYYAGLGGECFNSYLMDKTYISTEADFPAAPVRSRTCCCGNAWSWFYSGMGGHGDEVGTERESIRGKMRTPFARVLDAVDDAFVLGVYRENLQYAQSCLGGFRRSDNTRSHKGLLLYRGANQVRTAWRDR